MSDQEPPPEGLKVRAVLGEKGIGRLAVAAIGRQTLIITRSRNQPLTTAALLHWGAFELRDADLSQIAIPIREFRASDLPDAQSMALEFADTIRDLAGPADAALMTAMAQDLEYWSTLDLGALSVQIGSASLVGEHGTCFVIAPISDDLEADLDQGTDAKQAPPLLKTLIGFANTMTPGHPAPELETSFFDHRREDEVVDLIEETEFFTPEEFLGADHHFQGFFDEFGQFRGTVTIFKGEPHEYEVAWSAARGRPTRCGPFRLDLAYVQGRASQSSLEPMEFRRVSDKLDRYGGLYIYRDNIRVLPYGDNRFDWLDVELQRTKSAADNFFSYRRMFGAVSLTRGANSGLREKAGREGFATNEAYRQFRSMLKSFLSQVAVDFFRETGSRANDYREGRLANERLDRARAARGKSVAGKRHALRSELQAFFDAVDSGLHTRVIEGVVRDLRSAVSLAATEELGHAAHRLAQAESTARQNLRELETTLDVKRPSGVGLNKELLADFAAYEQVRAEFKAGVLEPIQREIEEIIDGAQEDQQSALSRRLRFDDGIRTALTRAQGGVDRARAELRRNVAEFQKQCESLASSSRQEIGVASQNVQAQAARFDVSAVSSETFVAERSRLEELVSQVSDVQVRLLESVTEQLRQFVWPQGSGPDLVTSADQMEELEQRLEAFLERAELDAELTQLGMAVEIVNHEFQTSIKSIRANLRRFKGWADSNPALREVYQDLRASFDHLDGYLKLFTPLHRRLYRSAIDIQGADISRFLQDLFGSSLENTGITLSATDAFRSASVRAYPSTLYPAFVNLVDNAIHWLRDYPGDRVVTLDADVKGDLLVTDTGPGVPVQDASAIFELGFSRKQGGTGYGLYLAREALKTEDMRLVLDPPNPDRGAQFRIVPPEAGARQ